MPDLVEDIEIYPLMVQLAAELETRLEQRGVPVMPVPVLPEGLPVPDYFGSECEGYAWVRLAFAFPYRSFPEQDSTGATCLSLLAYELEVGYTHCAPMPDDDGTPPSMEEQVSAARIQTSAMAAMRAAIQATLDEADRTYVLGAYDASLAGGGMLGATWRFTVGDRNG